MRIDWNEYFFKVAETISLRASCPRASVGVVIVSKDNRILATGYNGAPAGAYDCLEQGCIIEDGHCQRALHAEVNAIAAAAKYGISLQESKMYVYGKSPCRECMKVVTAVGVRIAIVL